MYRQLTCSMYQNVLGIMAPKPHATRTTLFNLQNPLIGTIPPAEHSSSCKLLVVRPLGDARGLRD
jgi:hypothetical protein